jgi:hypothetical protein
MDFLDAEWMNGNDGRLDQSSCSQTLHRRHGPPTRLVTCSHVPASDARLIALILLAHVHRCQWMVVIPLRAPEAVDQTNCLEPRAGLLTTSSDGSSAATTRAAPVGAGINVGLRPGSMDDCATARTLF